MIGESTASHDSLQFASADKRDIGRYGEIFNEPAVNDKRNCGKGQFVPLREGHPGQAQQMRPVQAKRQPMADECKRPIGIASSPCGNTLLETSQGL